MGKNTIQPGRFKVVRSFIVSGETHSVGETVALDNAGLIGLLLSSGKIEPADAATRSRIREHHFLKQWTAVEKPGVHGRPPWHTR